MSYKFLIILICLLVILYLYNKNQIYDKLEHFDDNIINQIASIVNGEEITLKNVNITGKLKVNSIDPLTDNIKMNTVDISNSLILPKNTTGTHIKVNEIEVNQMNPIKDTIKMNNVDISKKLILPKNTTGEYINVGSVETKNIKFDGKWLTARSNKFDGKKEGYVGYTN